MDAAISEDIRKTIYQHKLTAPGETRNDQELSEVLLYQWLDSGAAGSFWQLHGNEGGTIGKIIQSLKEAWDTQILRFNTKTTSTLTVNSFINNFILTLAKKTESRSIITALYSFVLEYEEIKKLINLRSSLGGSIEPIITWLFKGALIFESLLKFRYLTNDNGKPILTIGGLSQNSDFKKNYDIQDIQSSASSLNNILTNIGNNNDVKTAFCTTAKIRNTSGHNLMWDDIFNSVENLEKIYEQIVNAFLFIHKIDFP